MRTDSGSLPMRPIFCCWPTNFYTPLVYNQDTRITTFTMTRLCVRMFPVRIQTAFSARSTTTRYRPFTPLMSRVRWTFPAAFAWHKSAGKQGRSRGVQKRNQRSFLRLDIVHRPYDRPRIYSPLIFMISPPLCRFVHIFFNTFTCPSSCPKSENFCTQKPSG